MADITKCTNEECELKNKCRRYTAQCSQYNQSWEHYNCNEENQYENILEIWKVK